VSPPPPAPPRPPPPPLTPPIRRGNFFGFQDSSVRNQAEHILILLSNHRRYVR
jgi:hypothetical protein